MWMLKNPQTGQIHPIPERGLRIGRAAGNDLTLADDEVSRYHATVWVHGGQVYIRDEHSTNGTWVNERRITAPTPLRPGDRIRLGRTVLEVVGPGAGATVVSMPWGSLRRRQHLSHLLRCRCIRICCRPLPMWHRPVVPVLLSSGFWLDWGAFFSAALWWE